MEDGSKVKLLIFDFTVSQGVPSGGSSIKLFARCSCKGEEGDGVGLGSSEFGLWPLISADST